MAKFLVTIEVEATGIPNLIDIIEDTAGLISDGVVWYEDGTPWKYTIQQNGVELQNPPGIG
jgi:hypothetical protein